MQLDREECARFYKLNFSLLAYVGRKRNIGQPTGTSLDFAGLPLAKKTEIRDSLYQHIDLVDSFARENPFNFDRDDLQIVSGRRLKALGVKDAWFAILEGLIVAAGASKAECGEIADKVLPPEKARFVYYHRVKG